MLWLIAAFCFFYGGPKAAILISNKEKKRGFIVIIVTILVTALTILGGSFLIASPMRGKEIQKYDITGKNIYVKTDRLKVQGIGEEIPYSTYDELCGYTEYKQVSDDENCYLTFYEDRFSTAKLILAFKKKQYIVTIEANNNNNIIL